MGPFRSSAPGFGNTEKVFAVVLILSLVGFAVLLAVVHRGFEALSGARAYVEGEAHWSKAQKDAVYHLVRFALLEEDERYDRFLRELDVIHGDRQARLELESDEPDMDRVREGFLRGRNHPEDVHRLVDFFQRYRHVSYVERAVEAWERGDRAVDELARVGEEIRAAREEGAGPAELEPLLADVEELNRRLTLLEARFSQELGDGARWAQGFLFRVAGGTAAILILLTGGLGWTLTRRLRRAEASTRASEARYRGLYENSPFGILRTDADDRIVEVNPTLLAMLDVPDERNILGDPVGSWFPADAEASRHAGDGGEDPEFPSEPVESREVELQRGDGGTFVASLTGRSLQREDGRPAGREIYVEDVTRRRILEERLREVRKMEAIGHLAGGIAQDFNNLLTVALSSASLARREMEAGRTERALQHLEMVEKGARQEAEIVGKLLAFARRSPLDLQPVDLVELVRTTWSHIEHLVPPSIDVRLHVEETCPPVTGDPEALTGILLDLVTNARDAMPEGGIIEVTVELQEDEENAPGGPVGGPAPESSLNGRSPTVVLRVKDSGAGVPQDILDRAFEPFVTTKGPHAGTGLGLPTVYGLARQQDGDVTLRNSPQGGAEVEVRLTPTHSPTPSAEAAD